MDTALEYYIGSFAILFRKEENICKTPKKEREKNNRNNQWNISWFYAGDYFSR